MTTTATTECDTLLSLLNALARGAPGTTLIDGGGGDRAVLRFALDDRLIALPSWLLAALESDWHVKVTPALMSDDCREPVSAAVLFARFRPAVEFVDCAWCVPKPEQAKIRDALAGFVPPAFVVDALREVVAVWPLREPLRDMTRARALQRRLAERLGTATANDVEMSPPSKFHGPEFVQPVSRLVAADDPGAFISIAGKCKDVGTYGPLATIRAHDADRAYTLSEIEAALTPPTPETDTPKKRGARP